MLQKFPKLVYLRSIREVVMKNNTFITILQTFRKDLLNAVVRTNTVKLVQSRIARDQIYFPNWASFRII
jgi:hypothetical protein